MAEKLVGGFEKKLQTINGSNNGPRKESRLPC
jgi:hypothetical protein